MKKYIILTIFGVVSLGLSYFCEYTTVLSYERLRFEMESTKNAFKVGEPISFSFKLTNATNQEIVLLDSFGVGTGHLQIVCSKDGSEFVPCNNPRWGTVDC